MIYIHQIQKIFYRVGFLFPILCLLLLSFCVQAKAASDIMHKSQADDSLWILILDTCYIMQEGDSMMVVCEMTKDSKHEIISYRVSLANHQFRTSKQVMPPVPPGVNGLDRLFAKEKQFNIYMKKHGEYIQSWVDSTIYHLLPVGTDSIIKKLYPYEFRDVSFDIDIDGYILAAKIYVRHPVQFRLIGGVRGCREILRSFIGKRLPTEQLPTIGKGFCITWITFFRNEKKKGGVW